MGKVLRKPRQGLRHLVTEERGSTREAPQATGSHLAVSFRDTAVAIMQKVDCKQGQSQRAGHCSKPGDTEDNRVDKYTFPRK